MKNQIISIIIPCYNAQDTILFTIDSVIDQSYTGWELIIVDDSSTDETVSMIRKHINPHSNINLITMDENFGGPSKPRNIGIQNSNGSYIAFLDADDYWHPRKLEIQLSYLKKYDPVFCYSDVNIFKTNTEISDFIPQLEDKPNSFRYVSHNSLLRKNKIISGSSVLIAKKYLRNMKFDEDPRYIAVEDYLMWLRLLEPDEKCLHIKQSLVYYRQSITSISKNKMRQAKKIFYLLRNYIVNGNPLGFKAYYYMMAYVFLSIFRVKK